MRTLLIFAYFLFFFLIHTTTLSASPYNMKIAEELKAANEAARACGVDRRCLQNKQAQIFKLLAQMQKSHLKTKDSGGNVAVGRAWEHSLPLDIQIDISYTNKEYSELHVDRTSRWNGETHINKEERIKYRVKIDGLLAYDGLLDKFRLYTPVHSSNKVSGLDFLFRTVNDGITTTKTEADIDRKSPMVTSLNIASNLPNKPAYINVSPMVFQLYNREHFGDTFHAPGTYNDNRYKVTRKELRKLLNHQRWKRKVQWTDRSGPYGSYTEMYALITVTPKKVKSTKPGKLIVMPKSDFKASKKKRDKHYKPKSKIYTLKNVGKSSLDYMLKANKTWITLSQKSGTLKAGQSTKVTIGLHNKTSKFKDASNEATVNFTDLSSSKSTQRKVILNQAEKWMYSVYGYDVVYFGGTIFGGIKVHWRTDVTFTIEDGKYKSGKGHTYFTSVESYAYPKGVYKCSVLDGKKYITKDLKLKDTPYIDKRKYSVAGKVNGGYATLYLPKENFWYIDYICYLNPDATKEREKREVAKLTDAMPLPNKPQVVPLKDGWSEVIEKKKFLGTARRMKQLE